MGFYGNITNNSRTSFIFDATYSSRYAMDTACSTDGVYAGRYVLVNYDADLSLDSFTSIFKCFDRITDLKEKDFVPNKYYYYKTNYKDNNGNVANNTVLERDSTGALKLATEYKEGTVYALEGNYKYYTGVSSFATDKTETSFYFSIDKATRLAQEIGYTKANVRQSDFYTSAGTLDSVLFSQGTFYIYDAETDYYEKQVQFDWDLKDSYYKRTGTFYILKDNKYELYTDAYNENLTYYIAVSNIKSGTIFKIPSYSSFTAHRWYNEAEPKAATELLQFNGKYSDSENLYLELTSISDPEAESFSKNYNIDTNYYHVSRGYDSTVWQKTFVDGVDKYVMVAELNTVVPTFDLVGDAPTMTPLYPHFDGDSTNVYYKLHWQPQWGMRIKGASKDTKGYQLNDNGGEVTAASTILSKDTKDYPSDETTVWRKYSYSKSDDKTQEYFMDYDASADFGKWTASGSADAVNAQPAAIYYNKNGFDVNEIVKSSDKKYSGWGEDGLVTDEIQIAPTGLSGHSYHKHNGQNVSSPDVDSQEISVMLPSLGDTISDIWDIVYGDREINNDLISYNSIEIKDNIAFKNCQDILYVYNNSSGTYELATEYNAKEIYYTRKSYRNLNISWEDAGNEVHRKGLRLISDINKDYYKVEKDANLTAESQEAYDIQMINAHQYYIKDETTESGYALAESYDTNAVYYKLSSSGYTYNQDQINTLAGSINSVHDLMGMIIVDDSDGSFTAESGKVDEEHVYYRNGRYEVLRRYYDIDSDESILSNNNFTYTKADDIYNEGDFQKDLYYDVNGNPITSWQGISTNYYLKSIQEEDRYLELKDKIAIKNFYAKNTGPYYKKTKQNEYIYKEEPEYEQKYYIIDGKATKEKIVNLKNYEAKKFFEASKSTNDVAYNYTLATGKTFNNKNNYYQIINSSQKLYYNGTESPDGVPVLPYIPWFFFVLDEQTKKPSSFVTIETLLNDGGQDTIYYMANRMEDSDQRNGYNYNDDGTINQNAALANCIFENFTPVHIFHPNGKTIYYKNADNANYSKIDDVLCYSSYKAFQWYSEEDVSNDSADYAGTFLQKWQDYTLSNIGITAFNLNGTYLEHNKYWDSIKKNIITNNMGGNIFELSFKEVLLYEQGKYYYVNKDQSYIIDNEASILDETRVYYSSVVANLYDYYFYIPNKYYSKITGSVNSITLDNTTIYSDDEFNKRSFYKLAPIFVSNDTNKLYTKGTAWIVDYVPHGITLAKGIETKKFYTLEGFGRDLNTIIGLIIKINHLLELQISDSRDTDTITGCINTIKDIINKFDNLYPGRMMIVDDYGRLNGADYSTSQEYTYKNYGNGVTGKVAAEEDRFIQLDIDSNPTNPQFVLKHNFHNQANTTTISDKNNDSSVYNSNANNKEHGDTIKLYTPIIDNMGHVVGNNTETVTLPFGFKILKSENSLDDGSSGPTTAQATIADIIADNTQDTLSINSGNKWLQISHDATKDLLTINHEVHKIDYTQAAGTNINGNGDTITIQDIENDNAGHLTKNKKHIYTLPYGFKTITTNGRSTEVSENATSIPTIDNVIADNTQDTLAIDSGNKWIRIDTDAENDKITIRHDVHSTSSSTSKQNLQNETSETVTFDILSYNFDEAGHFTKKDTKTITMPFGYGKVSADSGSTSAASATYDTIKLSGDNWIASTGITDEIKFSHKNPVTTTHSVVSNMTPSLGESFTITDWDFDAKGHKANSGTHTITLPSLELSSKTSTSKSAVLTSLSYTKNSTVITETHQDVGTLLLTGYAAVTNGYLSADNTLNGALQIVDNKLVILNNGLTEEIKRAEEAEKVNADDITDEVTRAKEAEKNNSDNIFTLSETLTNNYTATENIGSLEYTYNGTDSATLSIEALFTKVAELETQIKTLIEADS